MKRNILGRLGDDKPKPVDHSAVCQRKHFFGTEELARRGWLHAVYKCRVCIGWHRTRKNRVYSEAARDMKADMYGDNGNG